MGEAAARSLMGAGARLTVINRSPQRGAELAEKFGGQHKTYDALMDTIVNTDVVISCTSSEDHVYYRGIHE